MPETTSRNEILAELRNIAATQVQHTITLAQNTAALAQTTASLAQHTNTLASIAALLDRTNARIDAFELPNNSVEAGASLTVITL
jgi:hypothetical protein